MKKKNASKFLVAMFLVAIMCLFINQSVNAENAVGDLTTTSNHCIDEPYVYPVIPGSDEWASLENHLEKIDVCQIPEEIVKHLTTEALLASVLDYPLLGDMFAWGTIQDGYDMMLSSCNGLQELVNREDLKDALENSVVYDECDGKSDYRDVIAEKALSVIKIMNFGESSYAVSPNWASTTVYTPAGSAVTALTGVTYELATDWQYSEKDVPAMEAYYATTYPNAVKIGNANPQCNCHSYGWYGEGSVNQYYIANPDPYMTDGSYIQVSSAMPGDMVSYIDTSLTAPLKYVHTAVCSTVLYVSKWGPFGVYRHGLTDCPYYSRSNSITYWRKNLDYEWRIEVPEKS